MLRYTIAWVKTINSAALPHYDFACKICIIMTDREMPSPSADHGGSPKCRRCSPVSPNYQLHHVVFNTASPGTAAASVPAVATTRQEDRDHSGFKEEGPLTQPPDLSFSANTTVVGNVASPVNAFGYVASPVHAFC